MRTFLIFLYSFFASAIFALAKIFKGFNPRLEFQFKDRIPPRDMVQKIAHKRSQCADAVLFFCSSAGEYEQAKPLILHYGTCAKTYILIVFHSQSGFDFARVRNEKNDYCLAPADAVWSWGSIFAAVNPRATFVIRYELWPAFLETAAKYSKLYLVNGSAPKNASNNKIKKSLQSVLLKYFNKVFVVDENEAKNFSHNYSITPDKIIVTGDTKYDRVMQLAQVKSLPTIIKTAQEMFSNKLILVLGSCYKEDILLLTNAIKKSKQLLDNWHVILVPHELDETNLNWISHHLQTEKLAFSFIDSSKPNTQVTIVDKVGLLTSIYGIANLAWVGGAIHNRVHNVLEPASYGVPLAFGPNYHTSHEAIKLVASKKADVILDPDQFMEWWTKHSEETQTSKHDVLKYMTSLCGATSIILKEV